MYNIKATYGCGFYLSRNSDDLATTYNSPHIYLTFTQTKLVGSQAYLWGGFGMVRDDQNLVTS